MICGRANDEVAMTTIRIPRHDIGDAAQVRARRDGDRCIADILLARPSAPRDATVLMDALADAAAAELALGTPPAHVAGDLAQAAAFGTAAALDARHPGATVSVGTRSIPCGDVDMHAWRWWRAFTLASVAGVPAWRRWIGRADVIDACQSPPGKADAFWPEACRAFAAATVGAEPRERAGAAAPLGEAQIAVADFVALIMQPRLAVIAALGGGDSAAWSGALAAALRAHHDYWGRHPRYETPEGFVAWDLGALRAAAAARGLHDDIASPYLDLPPLSESHQPISLTFPPIPVADALEAHWLIDRGGFPREGRSHRTEWRDGMLVAHYNVPELPDAPAANFSFVITATPGDPPSLRALDPGQALGVADALSRQVPGTPPADPSFRRAARSDLAEAMAALARVRAAIPAGADRVPNDAFCSIEGEAIRDAEPGRFRRERLDAVYEAWRGMLGEYDGAARLDDAVHTANALARAATMAELARPLLQTIERDPTGFLAAVRPQPDDAARAFVPEAAEAAARAYDMLWRNLKPPRPEPGQTELHIVAAPAGLLSSENVLSAAFPTGYRDIAHLLQPQRVWVRWQHVRPGVPDGLALDGLVWLEDHWAWFPRPHRVLVVER
jgi:hypothetical protein